MEKWSSEKRPGLLAVAVVALEDTDPATVIAAAGILEAAKDRSASAVLIRALAANRDRPDGYGPSICRAIMSALGATGDPSAMPVLVAELNRHDDLSYDNVAVAALGVLGKTEAAPALQAHIARLERLKPTDPYALGPWRNGLELAQKTLKKLQGEVE